MIRAGVLVAMLAVVGACERRAPIASCADDLTGEYSSGERRWMVIDHGLTVEAFPLFPDVPAGTLETAPRAIEWSRGRTLVGTVHRRYMQADKICIAEAPATIASCEGDTLEVVLADPTPPLEFTPCRSSNPEPSRRERWIRR